LADRDGNGECTTEELAVVPGLRLKEAMEVLDSDKSGTLSEPEILQWLTALRQTKVAVATAAVCIMQRGEPVPGLRVRIVPEPCMGKGILVAEGNTDETGIASLRIPSLPLGAHFGIYRIQVSGNDRFGRPVPAKYNSESAIGLIVPLFERPPTFSLD
jgi:hypothetical protein